MKRQLISISTVQKGKKEAGTTQDVILMSPREADKFEAAIKLIWYNINDDTHQATEADGARA